MYKRGKKRGKRKQLSLKSGKNIRAPGGARKGRKTANVHFTGGRVK